MSAITLKRAVWASLTVLVIASVIIAALSPLQASRNTAYIIASLAGIVALGILALQPLLARGHAPEVHAGRQRRWHRVLGGGLVLAVVLHVGGLYLTSAPDTLDALLLVSPTPFSIYGVTAMWAIALTALLASVRRKLGMPPKLWRGLHTILGITIVVATVIHAVQIEGAMGWWSKIGLSGAALVAFGWVLWVRHRRGR